MTSQEHKGAGSCKQLAPPSPPEQVCPPVCPRALTYCWYFWVRVQCGLAWASCRSEQINITSSSARSTIASPQRCFMATNQTPLESRVIDMQQHLWVDLMIEERRTPAA